MKDILKSLYYSAICKREDIIESILEKKSLKKEEYDEGIEYFQKSGFADLSLRLSKLKMCDTLGAIVEKESSNFIKTKNIAIQFIQMIKKQENNMFYKLF